MNATRHPDYTVLDQPQVLTYLFHPRKDPFYSDGHKNNLLIPVADGMEIGGCFHMTEDKKSPSILFFHGNGEIVSDYDDLGGLYNGMGINFLAVDYRGYGRSTGDPTVAGMMQDCHLILEFTLNFLKKGGYQGDLTVMGRSLGSASALELASTPSAASRFKNLVIESGFAFAAPLLETLGIPAAAIGFKEEEGFSHVEKIAKWKGPTLIIHAEFDHIIPFSDGQALFDACGSGNGEKELIKILGANHNDIFMRGMDLYMDGIKRLLLP